MTWPQVHLVLNHVPILSAIAVALVLLYAVLRRRGSMVRGSLVAMVLVAICTYGVMLTGHPTEHAIEDLHLPGVVDERIEAHEEMADTATWVLVAGGVFALIGLIAYRRPRIIPGWFGGVAVLFALGGAAAVSYTGVLGGEIRHTEVRPAGSPGATPPAPIGAGGAGAEDEAYEHG